MPKEIQNDKLSNFYKMLDKSHANVIQSSKPRSNSGRDWDLLKFSKQKKIGLGGDAKSTITNMRSIVPPEEIKI
jgi:hypothetical protein